MSDEESSNYSSEESELLDIRIVMLIQRMTLETHQRLKLPCQALTVLSPVRKQFLQ